MYISHTYTKSGEYPILALLTETEVITVSLIT